MKLCVYFISFLSFVLWGKIVPLSAAVDHWSPQSTFVFATSIWNWPAKAELEDLDPEPREEVLLQVLKKRGVPVQNMVHLQGKKASHKAMIRNLEKLMERSTAGSTFIFYFQGHSLSEKGELLMCCYDYDANDPWATSFRTDELWQLLKKWKGERLLLLGDTCYSGVMRGLIERIEKERPEVKAATLPSAMASNTSSAAWTYTNALIMGFNGYWFADKNQNGAITFSELEQLVRGEMKYGEDQLTRVFKTRAWKNELILGDAEEWPSTARSDLAFELGHYLEAQCQSGEWLGARIVEYRPKSPSWRVHFCGYSDDEDEWVDLERLRPFERQKLRVGKEYEVQWDDGKWRTAKLTRNMEDFFYYAEYKGGELAEWVTAVRIRGSAQNPEGRNVKPLGLAMKDRVTEEMAEENSSTKPRQGFVGRMTNFVGKKR